MDQEAELKRVLQCCHIAAAMLKRMNIKKGLKAVADGLKAVRALDPQLLAAELGDRQNKFEAMLQRVGTPAYAAELEQALAEQSIRFEGKFPSYDLLVLRLQLDPDGVARLRDGKKVKSYQDLEPKILAKIVADAYKAKLTRAMPREQFAKELIEAYEVETILATQRREPMHGLPVSLDKIYARLHPRASHRKETTRELFAWDLARFRQGGTIEAGKRFEFGSARDQSKAWKLRSETGREVEVSNLAIHNDANGEKT